jgi:hypothetical protein
MPKAALACLVAVAGIAPAGDPQFDVATVRPNYSGSHMGRGPSAKNGKFTAENISLKTLIASAYEVREFQVMGPGWLASEQYDITAKLPEGVLDSQTAPMLRTLLEERFHLRTHRETAEMSIYALVAGKAGPKFRALGPGEEFKPPAFPLKSAFTLLNGGMARWAKCCPGSWAVRYWTRLGSPGASCSCWHIPTIAKTRPVPIFSARQKRNSGSSWSRKKASLKS